MAKTKSTSIKPGATKRRYPAPVAKPVTKVASDNLLSQATPEPQTIRQLIVEPNPIGLSDNLLSQTPTEPNTTIEINGDVNEINTPVMAHKGATMRGVLIGVAGGSVVAYLSYNGIKTVLLDKGYDQDKANQYALISAGVCALVTFTILYNVLK